MACDSEHGVRRLGPLEFPCDTAALASVRATLREFLKALKAEEMAIDDVTLAVDEVCSNIIRHGFPNPASGDCRFSLALEASNQEVLVVVRDPGNAFDQTIGQSKDIDDWLARGEKGGLGLSLISALVDECRYRRDAAGINEIELRKGLWPSTDRPE